MSLHLALDYFYGIVKNNSIHKQFIQPRCFTNFEIHRKQSSRLRVWKNMYTTVQLETYNQNEKNKKTKKPTKSFVITLLFMKALRH